MIKENIVFKLDSILVLGGTGMVGSSIVRKLKSSWYANVLTPTRSELDLLNTDSVSNYFSSNKIDYIFFAAARVGGIKANMSFPATFGTENMTIILNVFEAAAYHNVSKMLFLGSSCIYPRECPQPMREEDLLSGKFEPTNEMYALSKAFGIKLCHAYNKQYNTNFISCQPPNLYGENDNFHPEHSHVVSGMIRKFHEAKIANKNEISCWGTGNARRELMYVDDLADAAIFLMDNYNKTDEFINCGTGIDYSIEDLAKTVASVVGYSGEIKWDHTKPEGMPRKLMDSSKINKLGWSSTIGLREGIEKTYKWWLANGGSGHV